MRESIARKGWVAGLRSACLGAVALAALTAAQQASAANLVDNPNFVGSFAGWTLAGDTTQALANVTGGPTGTYAQLGASGFGILTEVVPTNAGDYYNFSYQLAGTGGGSITAYINTAPVASTVSGGPFGFTTVSYADFLATGPTSIAFLYSLGAGGSFSLTDVEINPVPLPGALVMFGGGVAALAGWGLQRRRKAA